MDYLALVGDSSDNIPGVKGVGPKTALELLQAYGDLDGVLAHAADIPAKRAREAVSQYADLARLSRELVTIQRDVPIALDLEALQVRAARLRAAHRALHGARIPLADSSIGHAPRYEAAATARSAGRARVGSARSLRPARPGGARDGRARHRG